MNRFLRRWASVLAVVAAGAWSPETLFAQTLRIIPLGDSITAANDPGYRGFLHRMLVDAGRDVDFLGNERSTPSAPAGVALDPDHEGHGGFSVGPGPSAADRWTDGRGNLFVNVDRWFARDNEKTKDADVVLLLVGVNDHANIGALDPGYDLETEYPKRLAGLLDKLLSVRPNVAILVSSVLPGGHAQNKAVFDVGPFGKVNPKIAAVAAARASHVAFYDGRNLQGTDLKWEPSDWPEGDVIHPNASGSRKLAAFWFASLQDFLKNHGLPKEPYRDSTAPLLEKSTPVAGAKDASYRDAVRLEFTEHVERGRGKITFKNLSGGPDVLLDMGDVDQVKLIRWELTLAPRERLRPATRYRLEIEPGALVDLFGNAFAGFGDDAFTFTTAPESAELYVADFHGEAKGWSKGNDATMAAGDGVLKATANGPVFYAYDAEKFTGDLVYAAKIHTANAEVAGLLFNATGPTAGWAVVFDRAGSIQMHRLNGDAWQFHLNGNKTKRDAKPFETGAGRTHDVKVEFDSARQTVDVTVNGKLAFDDYPVKDSTGGSLGFLASYNSKGAGISDAKISERSPQRPGDAK